jgi:hypothetical protein
VVTYDGMHGVQLIDGLSSGIDLYSHHRSLLTRCVALPPAAPAAGAGVGVAGAVTTGAGATGGGAGGVGLALVFFVSKLKAVEGAFFSVGFTALLVTPSESSASDSASTCTATPPAALPRERQDSRRRSGKTRGGGACGCEGRGRGGEAMQAASCAGQWHRTGGGTRRFPLGWIAAAVSVRAGWVGRRPCA